LTVGIDQGRCGFGEEIAAWNRVDDPIDLVWASRRSIGPGKAECAEER
jgi:hypothetical protein